MDAGRRIGLFSAATLSAHELAASQHQPAARHLQALQALDTEMVGALRGKLHSGRLPALGISGWPKTARTQHHGCPPSSRAVGPRPCVRTSCRAPIGAVARGIQPACDAGNARRPRPPCTRDDSGAVVRGSGPARRVSRRPTWRNSRRRNSRDAGCRCLPRRRYIEDASVSIFRVLSAPTTLSNQRAARLNRAPNIRLADRRARFGAV